MLRNCLCSFCRLNGSFGCIHNPGTLECGNLNNPAPELSGQLCSVDKVSILPDNIHHVHGNYHGNSKLNKLGCEIKVSFKVRTVNYIENCVRSLTYKVVSGHNLLKGVRRQ